MDPIAKQLCKDPRRSILHKLRDRQLQIGRAGSQIYLSHRMYSHITPNLTIAAIDKPPCFLRKFSPDGRFLVAICPTQSGIEVYQFRGSSALGNKLHLSKLPTNSDTVHKDGENIRSAEQTEHVNMLLRTAFSTFFRLHRRVAVTSANGERMNRECSLFLDDCRYVIMAGAAAVTREPDFHSGHRNNETIMPTGNSRMVFENYTIYLLDMEFGRVSDQVKFSYDKIVLSHNAGLSLCGNTLAVMCTHEQTVHLLHVDDGKMTRFRTIGRFCMEDEPLLIKSVKEYERSINKGANETVYTTFRQRLMSFLYRHACDEDEAGVRFFFRVTDELRSLKLWRMQLLDEQHLLIRLGTEDVVYTRHWDSNNYERNSYFIIYNHVTTQVLAFYSNRSDELVDLYETYCEFIRSPTSGCLQQRIFNTSMSNNIHASSIHRKCMDTIKIARHGGSEEANRRILATLPYACQSFNPSPYVDHSLYMYDCKLVGNMDRPRAIGDCYVKFHNRDGMSYNFRMLLGLPVPRVESGLDRRLSAIIFHPFEPFAISVQRVNFDYTINFHVFHASEGNDCLRENDSPAVIQSGGNVPTTSSDQRR